MKTVLFALFLALPLAAQTKAPELSVTEQIALQSLLDKEQANATERAKLDANDKALQSAAAQIQADVLKTHPGYHLTLNPIALVKDEAPKAKPEVKK